MEATRRVSEQALDTIFRDARSYNGYLRKPVSADHLHRIWELMKMGPTSANSLPARLVWCVSEDAKARLATLASAGNAEKIRQAPVTVIVGMDIDFHEQLVDLFPHDASAKSWFSNRGERETAALRNSSLQGAYLLVAARALGLDTGPMSGFDNAAVDRAFFADMPTVRSNFIATIGYGDPLSVLDRLPRPEFSRFNTLC